VYSECLPFTNIPHSTRLFTDFLSYSGKTRDFYPRSPFLSQWVTEGVTDKVKLLNYPADRREAVAAILERQNRAFGSSEKTFDNLKKFREGASVIVTGQQVGLFGGPLFSILKALTAVALAKKSEDAGVPAVPVFWLATEDHDLAEVNHVSLPTSDGALAELRTSAAGVEDSPVGDVRFGDEITAVVTQATEI
jgi:uncharacterized protein YllA (UPF0747 family)